MPTDQRRQELRGRELSFLFILLLSLAFQPVLGQKVFNGQKLLLTKASREVNAAQELMEKNQYEEALKHLNTALDVSKGKDDLEIFSLKGICEYQLGRMPQAVEQLSYAVSKVNSKEALPPKTPEAVLTALLYRAKAREAQKDLPTAIKDLQLLATAAHVPLKSKAYEQWSRHLSELDRGGNQDKAELLVAKAVEVDPKNAEALVFQAQLAIYERGYEEAVGSLEKAIGLEADPVAKAKYQSMLAVCKYRLGKEEEALAIFKDAVENAPESTKWQVYQQQANLVILNKLYDPAILEQAKLWANRAAILSEDCSNQITFAYMQALNNELGKAKETLKPVADCENATLKMSKAQLSSWISNLEKAAQQKVKVKAYGAGSWYYWGGIKAGLAEGKGKALSKDYLYEVSNGTFVNGTLVSGTLTNVSDGWTYSGAFSNGTISGTGKMTYAGGDVFSGKFVGNKPQGKGKWVYTDGSTYEGEVVNGTPKGLGKYLSKEGNGYEGSFKDGKPHGKGFLLQAGKKEAAEFTDGERNDAAYLAKVKAEQEKLAQEKQQAQALAAQRLKEEELAKAEKRQNSGKILGKTLALAGGALALTKAVDLGMSAEDATGLGAALVADVLTDGEAGALHSTLTTMNAANGNLSNPLGGNSAAAKSSSPGAAGEANDCGCSNDPVANKYKTMTVNGEDAQVNSVCAMIAYYDCMARNCSPANRAEWQKRADANRQVLKQMTGRTTCN